VVDKKRNFAGMLSTCLLNLGKSRESTYNMNMYGDKETFWIGFEAAGISYAFNPYTPGATGLAERINNGKSQICSIQLIHVDETHEPAWLNGALFRNKNIGDYRNVVLKNWMVEPGEWVFTDGHLACLVFRNTTKTFSSRQY
jgi:Mannosyltransferase putative